MQMEIQDCDCASADALGEDVPAPLQQDSEQQESTQPTSSSNNVVQDWWPQIVKEDLYLAPYVNVIEGRRWRELLKRIESNEVSLLDFAEGFRYFGFNKGIKDGASGYFFREWAPAAQNISIFGEFNNWDREHAWRCNRMQYGRWEVFFPDRADGSPYIAHNSLIRLLVQTSSGEWKERLPCWTPLVRQQGETGLFDSVMWIPPPYTWRHSMPPVPSSLRIFETHIGMSSNEPRLGSYSEFSHKVIPYVCALGYNCVQLMAVMEHGYYASFGYQVSNFFAVSSRFGTPDELKELVDHAHGEGLLVFLDVVHSHASANTVDGINMFDGSETHFFLPFGERRGHHELWGSRMFDYQQWETLRFLLSNLRWYLEEYRFDGFRFDGVTAMLYHHHGVGDLDFSYDHYFSGNVNEDAFVYLMLANEMVHKLRPDAITIAEEVSGLPGLCRSIQDGGVGFDYRLHMACPDMWVDYLSKVKDEDWGMTHISFVLNNRRWKEKCVAYVESHDQALVGDKTVAFWLMDKDMYDGMSTLWQPNPIIERGIALHKMLRLVTSFLGGEAYLNFMGNEFGHPEWIDFPRPGNANSYHYARRRWDLARDPLLRYQYLRSFDAAMNLLEQQYHWLSSDPAFIRLHHNDLKVIVAERAGLVALFNFHSTESYTDFKVGVSSPGIYRPVLLTDDKTFGGQDRQKTTDEHPSVPESIHGHEHSISTYLPCRTATVLAHCGPEQLPDVVAEQDKRWETYLALL